MKTPDRGTLLRVVLWVVAGMVLLASAAVAVTAVTLPGCGGCHARDGFAEATQKQAHRSIDCVICHVPAGIPARLAFAQRVVFGMAIPIGGGPERARADVGDTACLSCHREVLDGITEARGLRVLHKECSKGRQCTDCHSTVAHGDATRWARIPQMDDCLSCHTATRAAKQCDSCHTGRTDRDLLSTRSTWAVTHGKNWRVTHGQGDWDTCGACHPRDYCSRCHGDVSLPHGEGFLRVHGRQAKAEPKACQSCHKQSLCQSCHGLAMPHPAAFTPRHAQETERLGRDACRRCHQDADCQDCHTKHVHPGGATKPPGGGG